MEPSRLLSQAALPALVGLLNISRRIPGAQSEGGRTRGQARQLERGPGRAARAAARGLATACADLVELYPDWVLATDPDAKQQMLGRDEIATEPVQNECAKLKHRDAAACMIHVVQRVIAPDFPEADRQLITDTPGFLYNECTSKYDK